MLKKIFKFYYLAFKKSLKTLKKIIKSSKNHEFSKNLATFFFNRKNMIEKK